MRCTYLDKRILVFSNHSVNTLAFIQTRILYYVKPVEVENAVDVRGKRFQRFAL